MEVNQIYNEDCLDTMNRMPRECIDLVVTSPPYDDMREYGGYSFKNFEEIAQSLYGVLKPGGVIVWVVADQTVRGNESGTSFRQALYFKRLGFNLFDTMIYLKPPRGACGNNKTYWQSFEYMFVFSKDLPKTINLLKDRNNKDVREGDRGTKRLPDGSLMKVTRAGYARTGRRTNVWEYSVGKGHSASDNVAYQHPAIFPEKLAEDHILSWSNPGDLIYDPFSGSGTTALMADLNDRRWIGSEVNKEYREICLQRLSAKALPYTMSG